MKAAVPALIVLALALFGGAPASAQTITVPEIADRAEQVTVMLRGVEHGPRDADDEAIASRLPVLDAWTREHLASTTQVLAMSPSPPALATLGDSWRLARRKLVRWNDTLTVRATRLERRVTDLETTRTTWRATRERAIASAAPATVLGRVDETIAAIAAAREAVDGRRARVLELLDQVVKAMARCDDALARIAQEGDAPGVALLSRDSLPIWNRAGWTRIADDPGRRLRGSLRDSAELTRDFLLDQRERIPLHIALVVVVAVLARRARTAPRRHADKAPSEAAASQVLELPISSALVPGLLATAWIYAEPPRVLIDVASVLVLVPAVRIVRRMISPALVPAVYGLAALVLIERVRDLCSVVPMLERSLFILEMLAGIVLLTLVARWVRRATDGADRGIGWRSVLVGVLWAQLVILVGTVCAGALGWMHLARLLGCAVLASDYVALVLYAGLCVGDGLVAYVLCARPLRRLFMVERHHVVLQQRITLALAWLAVGIWARFTLRTLGVMAPIQTAVGAALDARYVRGSLSVSLGDVVAFVLVVALAWALSSLVRFVLHEDVYPRVGLPRGVPYAASFFVHYTIVLAGFVVAIAALGVDLTRVTILAGALGVGVGIGLQNVVANFVAGLVLLLERRIHVGDAIQFGDLSGEVCEIGSRASTIRTWDGAEVVVPNSSLTSERVTNWTLSDRLRRVVLEVRVDYASDPEQVLEILRAIGRAHPKALSDPAPNALCTGFAQSALNFELRVWTAQAEEAESIASQLAVTVHRALGAAKIPLALPARDVHLRDGNRGPADALSTA